MLHREQAAWLAISVATAASSPPMPRLLSIDQTHQFLAHSTTSQSQFHVISRSAFDNWLELAWQGERRHLNHASWRALYAARFHMARGCGR